MGLLEEIVSHCITTTRQCITLVVPMGSSDIKGPCGARVQIHSG